MAEDRVAGRRAWLARLDAMRGRMWVPKPIDRARFTAEAASAQWDAGAWDYLDGIGELSRYGVLAAFARRLGGPEATILDVGCGEGLLREHIEVFERYVGIDVAPAAVERARRRWEDARTSFLEGDSSSVSGPFDIVIMNEVLQQVPDPERQLDRAGRLMGPRGWLLVSLHRHVDNRGIWRMISVRFSQVDLVQVRSAKARHSWRVGCFTGQASSRWQAVGGRAGVRREGVPREARE